MNDNNINLDYEPLGTICSSKGVSMGLYIFAGVLVIAGIIVNFTVLPSAMILFIFIAFAVIFALAGVACAKNIWYWGEEKFTINLFLAKPVTFRYDEIVKIYAVREGPFVTVMFRMKNGKEYGVVAGQQGAKEFFAHVDSKQKQESADKIETV